MPLSDRSGPKTYASYARDGGRIGGTNKHSMMNFNEFMTDIGFFVKENGQTVQNYSSVYTAESALKLWETYKKNSQDASKRSTR